MASPTGASRYDPLPFSTTRDPDFVERYGIDPGCDDGIVKAVPPVRAIEVLGEAASVCQPNYGDDLARFVRRRTTDLHECVRPDPHRSPACSIGFETPDGTVVPVSECPITADGPHLPDALERCWTLLHDAGPCSDNDLFPATLVLLRAPPYGRGAYLVDC